MPKRCTGEVRHNGNTYETRVTLEGRTRHTFQLPNCRSRAEADTRSTLVAEQARALRKAGHAGSAGAVQLLVELAAARTGAVSEILQAIAVVCGGETVPIVVKPATGPTFREVAELWDQRAPAPAAPRPRQAQEVLGPR
jgi:hypothetical protein